MPSSPEDRARLRRETLHALVVDDACEQLAADVAELLHAWLALHPEDAREADEIRTAVGLVGRACRSAPAPAEIVPGETAPAAMEPSTAALTQPRRGWVATVGAVLAASIVAVVAMTWRPRPAAEPEPAALPPIQWTRYELATDDSGRFTVRPASPGGTP